MRTMRHLIFEVEPMGAVRQVRSDAWRKRPRVMRYRAFRDQLRLLAEKCKLIIPDSNIHMRFHVSMPESWSKKKRAAKRGTPHQSTPDLDNLIKAFFDALLERDEQIFQYSADKVWADKGAIEIQLHD